MTDAELKAAEAWEQMICDEFPMPPEIGLDYVQDVTGSRRMAKIHLFDAGRAWLMARRPVEPSLIAGTGESVLGALTRYRDRPRRGLLDHFREATEVLGGPGAAEWVEWCRTAGRVFDVLDAVWAASEAA